MWHRWHQYGTGSATCTLWLPVCMVVTIVPTYCMWWNWWSFLCCCSGYPPTPNTPGSNQPGTTDFQPPSGALNAAASAIAAATATASATATATLVLEHQHKQQQQQQQQQQPNNMHPQHYVNPHLQVRCILISEPVLCCDLLTWWAVSVWLSSHFSLGLSISSGLIELQTSLNSVSLQ